MFVSSKELPIIIPIHKQSAYKLWVYRFRTITNTLLKRQRKDDRDNADNSIKRELMRDSQPKKILNFDGKRKNVMADKKSKGNGNGKGKDEVKMAQSMYLVSIYFCKLFDADDIKNRMKQQRTDVASSEPFVEN